MSVVRTPNLGSQRREGLGIGDVGAGLTTTATPSTGLATSTLSTTTTTFSAAEFTAATTATTTAATTAESVTGSAVQAGIVELDDGLFLALTLTLGLATGASNENVFLLIPGQGLAFWELRGSTLVGRADVLSSKRKLLFSKLSEIGSVRLALILGLLLGSIFSSAFDIGGDSVGLLVFLSNGLAR